MAVDNFTSDTWIEEFPHKRQAVRKFKTPEARGSYLSLASVHEELEWQIAEENQPWTAGTTAKNADATIGTKTAIRYWVIPTENPICYIEFMKEAVKMCRAKRETTMSIEERNSLVLDYLWCIDSVIHQNYSLMQMAHLDRDDVYQSLAMRLIRAVELYRPGPRSLKGYIFSQLRYELLNCKSSKARYGFCAAPYDLRGAVVSMNAFAEASLYWEGRNVARGYCK